MNKKTRLFFVLCVVRMTSFSGVYWFLYMRHFVFTFLLGSASFVFANAYCPESVPAKDGYFAISGGVNITPPYGFYSQSVVELARAVKTLTEATQPGVELVFNFPTDLRPSMGHTYPICFKVYVNGKIWPERDRSTLGERQSCGAWFGILRVNLYSEPSYTAFSDPATVLCPYGYKKGPNNTCINPNPKSTLCASEQEKSLGEQDCCVGNPIYPPTGNKFEKEVDYESPGPYSLIWARYYNSAVPEVTRLGQQWRHHFDRHVLLLPLPKKEVLLERPDGKRILFKEVNAGQYGSVDASLGTLSRLTTGGFQFYDQPSQVTETYDSDGKLKTLTYLGGYTQNLQYDEKEKLIEIRDTFDRTITLTYDNQKRIAKVQTPGGHAYQYEYDKENRLTQVTYPDGTARQYLYEVRETPRLLTAIINENGVRSASWSYNEQKRAQTSTHALSSEATAVQYDDKEGVRNVLDAKGAICKYEYVTILGEAKLSKIGKSACVTCPQGAHWTYDSKGFVTRFVNCQGLATDYTRDAFGRETKRIEAAGTSQGREIKTTWHEQFNLPVRIEEPLRTTVFAYNDQGLLTSRAETTNISTRTWRYRYNSQGLLTEQDSPREDVQDITRFEYDDNGKLLSIQKPMGQTVHIRAHDAEGRPTLFVDENGLEKQMAYDARGRLISLKEGARTTTFTYSPVGNLVEVTHPDGTKTKYEYDTANRLVLTEMPSGAKEAFAYDELNHLTISRLLDKEGAVISQAQWDYDSRPVPNQFTNGLGKVTQFVYDSRGYLAQTTNPLGAITQYQHDVFGRQIRRQDALGGTTTRAYNAQDQLVQLQDATRQNTIWTRNGFDQIEIEENHNRGTTTYTYDPAGNTTAVTNALGQTIQTTFDALNRPTQIKAPEETVGFVYDEGSNGRGRLSGARYSKGNITYEYDSFGQLLSQTDTVCLTQPCKTFKQSYQYGTVGRVHTVQYPSGHIQRFAYNPQGEVTSITLQTEQENLPIATNILTSPLNRWKALTLGNGIALERRFNLNGSLVSEQKGSQKTEHTYDANENLLSLLDETGQHDFGYDLLSRLIQDKGTPITYDAVGNRLTRGETTYEYKNNTYQLVNVQPQATLSYNAAGQLTQKNTLQFEHDAFGRLKSIKEGNTVKAEYVYDPFHLRVAKVCPGTQKVYFVYNSNGQLLAEYNEQLELLREYFYFQNEPIAVFTQNKLYYLQTNALGTLKLATDQNQQVVWRNSNTAFGEGAPVVHTIEVPLRFPGQYYDAESGLHYNWHRYYDPEVGRYIEPDPIGLAGGVSLYTYVNNNPLRWVDPEGLFEIIINDPGGRDGQTYAGVMTVTGDSGQTVTVPVSTWPNPTSLSPGIQAGEYPGIYSPTGHRRRTHGIRINNGREIPTLGPNPAQNNRSYATGINIHCGYRSNRRGSAGCITIHPEYCEQIWNVLQPGETGNININR